MSVAKYAEIDGLNMYEVEKKARTDLEPIRDQLQAKDATFIDTVEQRDTYYQHPVRDFAETDEALRLRASNNVTKGENTTFLTYKGPVIEGGAKTRREVETPIDDSAAMKTILEQLNFEAVATVSKCRERWRLDTATVCLDTVADLGSYVEIEVIVERDDVKTGAETANELLARLGIEEESMTTKSYLELILLK